MNFFFVISDLENSEIVKISEYQGKIERVVCNTVIVTSSPSKPPKPKFLGTYNEKPVANT